MSALATGISPFLGIVVGLLTAKPWIIVTAGVIIWCLGSAFFFYMCRLPAVHGKRSIGTSLLIWSLTFAPTFAITAIVTRFFLHR